MSNINIDGFSEETLRAIYDSIVQGYAPYPLKKVFNGKTYNTATADEVAVYEHGLISATYDNCEEKLYLTKKGNFFIIGEGESNTKWSKQEMEYGTRPLGHAMVPLTEQEARNWLEFRELYSEYAEIFGMPEEA